MSREKERTHYEVLGVQPTATKDELKRAFRKLSLKHHPDKGGSEEMFKEVNAAYKVLSSDAERRKYDMEAKMKAARAQGIPVHPFPPGAAGFSGNPAHINAMFEKMYQMFGQQHQRGDRSGKPPAILTRVSVTLEEAYTGKSVPLEIERNLTDAMGMTTKEKETVYVTVPPGVDNNEMIVLREKGHQTTPAGTSDAVCGDVKIVIAVVNDTPFVRRGLDLYFRKTISLAEALCGFKFELKRFDRSFTVNNVGTVIQPGTRKVVAGLGMQRGEHRGNLVIDFDIRFPTKVSGEAAERVKAALAALEE
jgi:DnaJ-class molecular chaperone